MLTKSGGFEIVERYDIDIRSLVYLLLMSMMTSKIVSPGSFK